MSFVDTTSSSAPAFYEKLGYILVGEIPDYPMEEEVYYFYYKKDLMNDIFLAKCESSEKASCL